MENTVYLLYVPGGALWGMHAAKVIAHIEDRLETPTSRLFNAAAGASTGMIVLGPLVVPHPEDPSKPVRSASEIVAFYREWGPRIFPSKPNYYPHHVIQNFASLIDESLASNDLPYPVRSVCRLLSRKATALLHHDMYDPANLETALKAGLMLNGPEDIGRVALDNTLIDLYTTAYDLKAQEPKLFWSRDPLSLSPVFARSAREASDPVDVLSVTMATTAASTMLPAQTVNGRDYIDNANSESALPAMLDVAARVPRGTKVKLVLVDTGDCSLSVSREDYNKMGILHMLQSKRGSILLNSSKSTVHHNSLMLARHLFGPDSVVHITKSLRHPVNGETLPSHDFCDATPGNMALMDKFGDAMVAENRPILDNLCMGLFENAVRRGAATDAGLIRAVRRSHYGAGRRDTHPVAQLETV